MKTRILVNNYRNLALTTLFAVAAAGASGAVITMPTIILPLDFTYDGQDVTVSSCVVSINGAHTFASLNIIGGGVVTHLQAAPGQPDNRINLTIVTDVLIDPISKIDVSFQGYGAPGLNGFTGPGAGSNGTNSTDYGSGGGYGGFGADTSDGARGGRPYGSLSALGRKFGDVFPELGRQGAGGRVFEFGDQLLEFNACEFPFERLGDLLIV